MQAIEPATEPAAALKSDLRGRLELEGQHLSGDEGCSRIDVPRVDQPSQPTFVVDEIDVD
jgi:hypothetical protein